MKLGIVGQGFVGNAVYQKFKKYYEVSTFDLDSSKANSTFESVAESDYVFVCLPTPMNEDGSCNTDIVEGVIKQIDEIGKTNGIKQIFSKVFPKAHIIKTNSTYAEMVKYVTNTFLSVKVSFANEIYQLCNEVGADYDKVIEYATMDERLGDSHWGVPGHDGDFGFGGHCFPKDLAAFLYLTKELGTIDNVLSAAQRTNDAVRWDRDWEKMEGRAVSKKSDNHTKNNSVE